MPTDSPTADCSSERPSRLRQRVLALVDPVEPAALTRGGKVFLWGIILALLLPTLWLPLSPDQGVFYTVARKLCDGGVLYRDIVDIKPPLIYHMYAGAISLFGASPLSIRAMDVLLQLFTCIMLWKVVKRVGGGEFAAALAALVYVLVLLAGGPVVQAQTESYVGLFALPVVWGTSIARTRRWLILAGLCCGALTLLKFTFGVVLFGALLSVWWFGKESRGERARMLLWVLLGWGGAMLFFVLYLLLPGVLDNYREVWKFTSAYGGSEWRHPGTILKKLTSDALAQFALDPSLLLTFAAALGVGVAAGVLRRRADAPEPERVVVLLRASLLLALLVWGTIVLEGHFLGYHFARYNPFFALLAAFGSLWLLNQIAAAPPYCASRAVRRLALLGGTIVAFYFSPLLAVLARTEATAVKGIARSAGVEVLGGLTQDLLYVEAERAAAYIRPRRGAGDEVMAIAGFAGLVYERCDVVPSYRLTHSLMYTADFTLPEWRSETRRYLTERRPRFVLVQTGDGWHPVVARDTLFADTVCASLLQRDYHLALKSDVFELYERNAGGK